MIPHMAAEILWEAPASEESRLPVRAGDAVPAPYAERAMNSLMRLHDELMGEKERRIELMRGVFERDRTIATLRAQVDALKRELERLRLWKQPRPGVNPPAPVTRAAPPPPAPVAAAPTLHVADPGAPGPAADDSAPGRPDPLGWKVW
jgi:hypothetical protein